MRIPPRPTQESSDAAPGVTFMLKGASAHQKIVLVRQKPTTAANNGQRKDGKTPSHVPSLTLQFAHHCLQNAAFNLDAASTGNVTTVQNTVRPVYMVHVYVVFSVICRVRLFNVGLHFLAAKVSFSCPSVDRFGKIFGGV